MHLLIELEFVTAQLEGEVVEPYFRRLVLRSVAHIIRLYSSSLITECEVQYVQLYLFPVNLCARPQRNKHLKHLLLTMIFANFRY